MADLAQRFSAFRQGDIRGLYPDEINADFISGFAHAFVGRFNLGGKVATGRDMRESSPALHAVLNETLASIGIEVVDIGMCPTELGYFSSGVPGIDAAIVVTASHNPSVYNGLKCVLRNGEAITAETGLFDIRQLMLDGYRHHFSSGSITRIDFHSQYLAFLADHFPPSRLRAGRLALNGLNGTAVTMAARIADEFQLPVTWFRKEPGPIPEQGADPANPRLAAEMMTFMAGQGFTLGVAWDGDCDRCVCFDSDGNLIPTYYLIGLMIEKHLREQPGGAIVFDTKLCWNTLDIIRAFDGVAIPAETGHAFMKQKMHKHRAVYGGELSSHHYFGRFLGCDSGMFAWLTVLDLLSDQPCSIQELIADRRTRICITPEINLSLSDVDSAFAEVLSSFKGRALHVDYFDGLGFSMPGDWRFSLRRSKTEPVVRVNFEARDTPEILLDEGVRVFSVLERFRNDDRDWLGQFHIQ